MAPFLDALLSVSSQADQRRFVDSLGAFEMLAIDRQRKPWKALTPAEQNELLTHASTAARGTTAAPTIRSAFDDLPGLSWLRAPGRASSLAARKVRRRTEAADATSREGATSEHVAREEERRARAMPSPDCAMEPLACEFMEGRYRELVTRLAGELEAHPNLTPVIDIGHFARAGVDPVIATRTLGAHAVAIHVKDVDAKGENMVVGEGTIDMPGVFHALRESQFDGLVVLEYEGDFDDMDRRLAGMRQSLVNMDRFIEAAGRG